MILPNKRSLFVLREKMEQRTPAGEHLHLRTVDELMESLSGMRLIEPEELLVTFYQVYRKLEKNPASFDSFTNWAVTFLSDINDIDLHLGDVRALFEHVEDYHRTGESFLEVNAGPLERHFLSFWKRLPTYHEALVKELAALGLGYRGLIYRKVSEMAASDAAGLHEVMGGRLVCWVGVIPGNPSEKALQQWVRQHSGLEVYADVDRYYLDEGTHEAGRLFRTGDHAVGRQWTVDMLGHHVYNVNIYPAAGAVSQLQRARNLVCSIPRSEWPQTVVVLADERMLMPLLEIFDKLREDVNITTGYPLRNTLIHRFVMSWIQLHAGALHRGEEKLFYHKHIEEFLEYSVIRNWLEGAAEWARLRDEVVERNMKFIPASWIRRKLESDLFAERAYHLLFDWPPDTGAIFSRVSDVLGDWEANVNKLGFAAIEREALPLYRAKLKLLLSQFNELLESADLRTLRKFIHRQVGYTRMYLEEPDNHRLQVMGMLETRMIDFKHVIVVGAADDTLPGNPTRATHIPFVHRVHFHLPTRKDTEALITYHFYRLLQRSEHIHLVYNTSTEALSGGEPSRFILQIQHEWAHRNPQVSLQTVYDAANLDTHVQPELRIEKTPDVIGSLRKFLAARVSPSALNTFINSPLEFYYYYVLGLKEQDRVEEEVEMSTFGSIVHDVLHWIYEPFKKKQVDLLQLRDAAHRVDDRVKEAFEKRFPKEDLAHGRNLIMVELCKRFVKGFISFDLREMEEMGPVRILELEDPLTASVQVDDLTVNILGFADRIDERNGIVRIVDYKTGNVTAADLRLDMDMILTDTKYSKALQLAFYKWAWCKRSGMDENRVESCIFSFRNQRAGYLPLSVVNDNGGSVVLFEEKLHMLIHQMLDTSLPFAHRHESKYVTF